MQGDSRVVSRQTRSGRSHPELKIAPEVESWGYFYPASFLLQPRRGVRVRALWTLELEFRVATLAASPHPEAQAVEVVSSPKIKGRKERKRLFRLHIPTFRTTFSQRNLSKIRPPEEEADS